MLGCFLFCFVFFNRGLDVSEALKLPGVVDVITGKDIPGKKIRPMFGYHEELLAENEVVDIPLLPNAFAVKFSTYERMSISPPQGGSSSRWDWSVLPSQLRREKKSDDGKTFMSLRCYIHNFCHPLSADDSEPQTNLMRPNIHLCETETKSTRARVRLDTHGPNPKCKSKSGSLYFRRNSERIL